MNLTFASIPRRKPRPFSGHEQGDPQGDLHQLPPTSIYPTSI